MALEAFKQMAAIRAHFPALQHAAPIFLDNPAGTQVPQGVLDAMTDYLRTSNANAHGPFATSQRTDAMLEAARQTFAAFFNAQSPREVVFGANMTTLTLQLSRALGRALQPGDEIIVTQMDHDANIAPWLLLAEDRGLTVRWVRLDTARGTLDMASYEAALNEKTRLVCVGHAANALGTLNPIATMAASAHAVGAQIFVDAVQSAPHLLLDVQALEVDYLVCSAYKFFGPHVGVLYAREAHLQALTPYKVRAAPDEGPEKWETGTKNFEGIAGAAAAVDYLASLGTGDSPRARLAAAFEALRAHEMALTEQLIAGLAALPHVTIHGITDPAAFADRVPTVVFRHAHTPPATIAQRLAEAEIYTWHGHYYALETMRALGLAEQGGMVRIGIAHYNTQQDIDRTLTVLDQLLF